MTVNKYGFFEYHDYAIGAKESILIVSDEPLQEGSDTSQIETGVEPWEFSSIEQDAYITRSPLELYNGKDEIGFLTEAISDENGRFEKPVEISIQFDKYYSMTGITINSRNVIKEIKITGLQNDVVVAEGIFSATAKNQFYPINLSVVSEIKLEISAIDKPYHFLGIFDIVYGQTRKFDDVTNVYAKTTNNFSVLGDTIEYDTLDLTIRNPKNEYMFQRRQPIYLIQDGIKKMKFFVDSTDDRENYTTDVLAYDDIANLEDDFLGGMYKKKPFAELINDIIGGIAEYRIESDEILLTGHIPICSRRKALQMVLLAANIKCYKEDVLVFKPLETSVMADIIDQTNIIGDPKKVIKQPVRSITLKTHNYTPTNEREELYHWYLSQTELTQINFTHPIHNIVAYEVYGTDENGQEIIGNVPSENVGFNKFDANYCIVHCSTSNKVVIVGEKYADSKSSVVKRNDILDRNQTYYDYTVDLTIMSDPDLVCESLFNLYAKKNSIRFKTLVDVKMGCVYNILGENYYIKKKKSTLNGIYEVEAF